MIFVLEHPNPRYKYNWSKGVKDVRVILYRIEKNYKKKVTRREKKARKPLLLYSG
jgi:hypothetical protein